MSAAISWGVVGVSSGDTASGESRNTGDSINSTGRVTFATGTPKNISGGSNGSCGGLGCDGGGCPPPPPLVDTIPDPDICLLGFAEELGCREPRKQPTEHQGFRSKNQIENSTTPASKIDSVSFIFYLFKTLNSFKNKRK
jgi:hypothetical protein